MRWSKVIVTLWVIYNGRDLFTEDYLLFMRDAFLMTDPIIISCILYHRGKINKTFVYKSVFKLLWRRFCFFFTPIRFSVSTDYFALIKEKCESIRKQMKFRKWKSLNFLQARTFEYTRDNFHKRWKKKKCKADMITTPATITNHQSKKRCPTASTTLTKCSLRWSTTTTKTGLNTTSIKAPLYPVQSSKEASTDL